MEFVGLFGFSEGNAKSSGDIGLRIVVVVVVVIIIVVVENVFILQSEVGDLDRVIELVLDVFSHLWRIKVGVDIELNVELSFVAVFLYVLFETDFLSKNFMFLIDQEVDFVLVLDINVDKVVSSGQVEITLN